MTKLMILRFHRSLSLGVSARENESITWESYSLPRYRPVIASDQGGVAIHRPVIASDRRERGNLVRALRLFYQIASSLRSSQRQKGGDCFVTAFLAKTHSLCHCERPEGARQSTSLSLRATEGSTAISSVHCVPLDIGVFALPKTHSLSILFSNVNVEHRSYYTGTKRTRQTK